MVFKFKKTNNPLWDIVAGAHFIEERGSTYEFCFARRGIVIVVSAYSLPNTQCLKSYVD